MKNRTKPDIIDNDLLTKKGEIDVILYAIINDTERYKLRQQLPLNQLSQYCSSDITDINHYINTHVHEDLSVMRLNIPSNMSQDCKFDLHHLLDLTPASQLSIKGSVY